MWLNLMTQKDDCWHCTQDLALTCTTTEWTTEGILNVVLSKWNINKCKNKTKQQIGYRWSCCNSSALCVSVWEHVHKIENSQSIKYTKTPNYVKYLKYFQVKRLKSKWSYESLVLKSKSSSKSFMILSSQVQNHQICDSSLTQVKSCDSIPHLCGFLKV